jgi:hypothetical protein
MYLCTVLYSQIKKSFYKYDGKRPSSLIHSELRELIIARIHEQKTVKSWHSEIPGFDWRWN